MSEIVKKILDEAASYVEKYGWIQHQAGGVRHRECHPACAWGALIAVNTLLHDHFENRALTHDAEDALNKHLDLGPNEWDGKRSLAVWNDTPGRTKEEVIAALRGAAASIEVSA